MYNMKFPPWRAVHRTRDGHVRGWAAVTSGEAVAALRTYEQEWGRIIATPAGPMGEPADIRIEFSDKLKSRRAALAFAQELEAKLRALMPSHCVEFVPASDHYHLLISERAAHEARRMAQLGALVSNLGSTLAAPGVTSGRRAHGSDNTSSSGIRWRVTEDE